MRTFPFLTVGKILDEIWEETQHKLPEDKLWHVNPQTGVKKRKYVMIRRTFYALEDRLHFPKARKRHGKLQWRIYTREEADVIKEKIKAEYRLD